MRSRTFIIPILLSTAMLAAQTAPAPKPTAKDGPASSAQQPATKATAVPLTAPVITIKGGCTDSAATGCVSSVTRAQFEKLIDALNPEMPESVRQSFAQNYGKLLMIANEAMREGITKDPKLAILVEFARLQVIAQELGKKLQKEANDVPQSAVEAYYKEHSSEYVAADIERVIAPRATASQEKPVDEAAEKAFAEKIRERWIAGEPAVKLQEEAFAHADSKAASTPPVELGERRRNSLPPSQASIFDLKAGEVSAPLPDPSAYFLYKVKKIGPLPLAQVEDEIRKTLSGQRLQAEMQRVTTSAEVSLNETYFGKVEAPSGPGIAPNPATPPAAKKPATPAKPAAQSPSKPEAPK